MATTATTAAELPRRFAKHLVPTERVVVASRRHLAQVLEPVLSFAASVAVVIWLEMQLSRDVAVVPQLLWLPPAFLLGRAAWKLWEWSEDWFVVTDRRLMLGYGVFTRRVAMMPMRKVTDMSYNRTPMGQVLNYGEFVLESAGQDQALRVVSWLPEPDLLYRLICTEIFGPDDWDDEDGPVEDAAAPRPRGLPDDDPPARDVEWKGFRLGPGGRDAAGSSSSDHQDTHVVLRRTVETDGDAPPAWDPSWDESDEAWDDATDEAVEEVSDDEPSPRGLRRVDPRRWRRRRRRRDDRWDD